MLHLPAVIVDGGGVILRANLALERLAGVQPGSLAGTSLRAIYRNPADRATLDFLMSHPQERDGTIREDEFYLPTMSGGRLDVLMSASRLPDVEGEVKDRLLMTFIDITRIKEAEQTMREHFKYVSQLSDTALEQALALKHKATAAEKEADHLREKTTELTEHSRELEVMNAELERRVAQRTSEIKQANLDAIYMLAVASEAKDHDTGSHVRRIRDLAANIAKAMGFSAGEAYDIGLAAVLHDVGKIHVPDAVLNKPGPLTDEERATMQKHTLWGQRILPERPFFSKARVVARSHHENFDGSGYPDSMAGLQIPVEARIVHVADVYDALVSPRVYKKAWPVELAIAELHKNSGTHFDPEVVKAFNNVINQPNAE